LIGHYNLYNDATQAKKYNDILIKKFSKCKETLRDTLQCEDYDEEGVVPLTAFQETFETLEINLDKEVLDYLMWVIYSKSESIEKMKYQVLFDLIEGKLVQG